MTNDVSTIQADIAFEPLPLSPDTDQLIKSVSSKVVQDTKSVDWRYTKQTPGGETETLDSSDNTNISIQFTISVPRKQKDFIKSDFELIHNEMYDIWEYLDNISVTQLFDDFNSDLIALDSDEDFKTDIQCEYNCPSYSANSSLFVLSQSSYLLNEQKFMLNDTTNVNLLNISPKLDYIRKVRMSTVCAFEQYITSVSGKNGLSVQDHENKENFSIQVWLQCLCIIN
jgi:hypothetical protein